MKKQMKKRKLYMVLGILVFLICFNRHYGVVDAGTQYRGGIVFENGAVKCVQNGLMPSAGNVDVLVILVEFPDVNHAVEQSTIEERFFGSGGSLRSFYKDASYGNLLISGDVYGWYEAEHEKAYYEQNTLTYPGNEMLFKEVVENLDAEIDFSKYDSDNDGYVDGIYLVCAGEDTGYNSTYWSYVKSMISKEVRDNTNISQFTLIPEKMTIYTTLAHETGHLLGLQDYYDTAKNMWGGTEFFGSDTLMNNNEGDLDALSKILLGWITPEYVTVNQSLSLKPSNEYPSAAIIYGDEESCKDCFFLVEYKTCTKNNGGFTESGIFIYRVNAAINPYTGRFRYDVSESEPRLVETINKNATSGVGMSPKSIPSSHFVLEDSSGNIVWESTGITLKDVVLGNNVASFNVVYGEKDSDEKFDFVTETVIADNRIYVYLHFAAETNCIADTVYAMKDGEYIPFTIVRRNYSDPSNKTDFYLYSLEKELAADTAYSILIPEGTFITSTGARSIQKEIDLTTCDYVEPMSVVRVEDLNDEEFDEDTVNSGDTTQSFPDEEGGYVYFGIKDAKLYMVRCDKYGDSEEKYLANIPDYDNYSTFKVLTAAKLKNGTYVLNQHMGDMATIYTVDENGVCEKKGQLIKDSIYCQALGNKAFFGYYYDVEAGVNYSLILNEKGVLEKVRGQNSWNPTMLTVNDKLLVSASMMADFEGNRYYKFYDENLNVMKTYIYPSVVFSDRLIGAVEQGENVILFANRSEKGVNGYISALYFDKNLEFVKEEIIYKFAPDLHMGVGDLGIYEYKGGYVLAITYDRAFDNGTGQGIFSGVIASPIANAVFMDRDFDILFSYTVDEKDNELSDSYNSIIQLSGGEIVCSTAWKDYIFTLPAMGISLNYKTLNLKPGEEILLTVQEYPSGMEVEEIIKWNTSDSSIVSVDNGKIKAVGKGTATITVEYNGETAKCQVAVKDTANPMPIPGLNGLHMAEDGNWYYYLDGIVQTEYTGLAYDNTVGWWYVENGIINFSYNGLVALGDVWWCVVGGQVAFDYTGLWNDPNVGWWYVENGIINFGYSGLISYGGAWWCVAGGQVIFDYTGLWNDPSVGWWYVENGIINFDYNGLISYGGAWWCVADGHVIFDYTGLWNDPSVGWWYVENGIINFDYNGLISYGGAWWCVAGGQVAFGYTGLWNDANLGWWYVENGVINFGYTGAVEYNGTLWNVVNGAVV